MPFPDWIGEVVAFRRKMAAEGTDLADYARRATGAGLRESADSGVAAIGEIATAQWPTEYFETGTEIQGTVFLELLGLSPERIEPLQDAAKQPVSGRSQSPFRRGLSPHAPYTVHPGFASKCLPTFGRKYVQLAMHLAESTAELELLRSHSGPLVERLKELGAWYPGSLSRGIRPLDYLEMLSAAHRVLVIHGNFLVAGRNGLHRGPARPNDHRLLPANSGFLSARHLSAVRNARCRRASRRRNRFSGQQPGPLHPVGAAAHCPASSRRRTCRNPENGNIYGAEALRLKQQLGTLSTGREAAVAVVPLPEAGDDPYELLLHSNAPVKIALITSAPPPAPSPSPGPRNPQSSAGTTRPASRPCAS